MLPAVLPGVRAKWDHYGRVSSPLRPRQRPFAVRGERLARRAGRVIVGGTGDARHHPFG